MRTRSIAIKIEKLRQIVAEWSEESTPAVIERDMAINYVQEIYEMLRFSSKEEEVSEVSEPTPKAVIEPETPTHIEESSDVDHNRSRLEKFRSLYCESEVSEKSEVIQETTAPTNREFIDTLSLNDRLLISNELFEGDIEQMERLMLILGAMPTLDDALIYIAQRYRWRGDNEGAKLLFAMLKNRYLQS